MALQQQVLVICRNRSCEECYNERPDRTTIDWFTVELRLRQLPVKVIQHDQLASYGTDLAESAD